MQSLYFSISYPVTWIILLIIIVPITLYLKHKIIAAIFIIFFTTVSFSLTDNGSKLWMDSIAIVTNVEGLKCHLTKTKSAILLPGGVVWMNDGSRMMTSWSEERVQALSEDINEGKISRVIIPGGHASGELNEGLRIKKEIENRLKNDSKKSIKIQVGEGSQSTFENFIELLPLLDKDMDYWLYTSSWHMYRSFYAAKKRDISVCPVIIVNKYEQENKNSSFWRLKVAVKEYAAIIWYVIKGKI